MERGSEGGVGVSGEGERGGSGEVRVDGSDCRAGDYLVERVGGVKMGGEAGILSGEREGNGSEWRGGYCLGKRRGERVICRELSTIKRRGFTHAQVFLCAAIISLWYREDSLPPSTPSHLIGPIYLGL